MSSYISNFSPLIDSFFDLLKALWYSPGTHAASMRLFDRYCAAAYPEEIHLTEKIVLVWLEDRCTDIYEKSITMRHLENRKTVKGYQELLDAIPHTDIVKSS